MLLKSYGEALNGDGETSESDREELNGNGKAVKTMGSIRR